MGSGAAQGANELNLKFYFNNNGELDFMTLRTLSKRVKTHKMLYLQHRDWQRCSCPEYVKNSNKLIEEWGRTLNRDFTEEDIQMTNKHEMLNLLMHQGNVN